MYAGLKNNYVVIDYYYFLTFLQQGKVFHSAVKSFTPVPFV